ncbi:uncharacterized protein BX663DRAFT_562974 [Cokeromyces recurvatus]|uniref:uncharacterized protein n=1 Tax=Cokeromyces recurvatus TaxID=90255 RepID=UPI00221F4131|nr:uncharacterized protein BX663DRAFT_562974 [Cokeromyces recurvatus]KAI7900629.1 hypothetical protein BX663DRAFT_562974 [Cokeromyces recurvatus]
MDKYSVDDEANIVPPTLREGEKKIVLVTHDESTFYSNDGKLIRWCEQNETTILLKGSGGSIMVSEFMCPCHGTMRGKINGKEKTSRKLFFAGSSKGKEGWWTCAHLVKQLEKEAIPLFELLHPGCTGLFAFDQSSSHREFDKDALIASRMSSEDTIFKDKPGGFKFKDGWFKNSFTNKKQMQPMHATRDFSKSAVRNDIQRTFNILDERGLFKKLAKKRKQKNSKHVRPLKCCAEKLHSVQPDFKEEKSMLE